MDLTQLVVVEETTEDSINQEVNGGIFFEMKFSHNRSFLPWSGRKESVKVKMLLIDSFLCFIHF